MLVNLGRVFDNFVDSLPFAIFKYAIKAGFAAGVAGHAADLLDL
jgi:hypothetical protein